jgi:hypothetical protein
VSERSAESHNPSHSYGLARKSKDLEEGKLATEQQSLEQKNLVTELIQQLQSDCLNRELEETLEGMYVIIHWPFHQGEAANSRAFSIFAPASFHMCPISLFCIALSLVSQKFVYFLFQFCHPGRNCIIIHE